MKRRPEITSRTEIITDLILDHLALVAPQSNTLDALWTNLSSYRHRPSVSEFNRHITYLIQHGLISHERSRYHITGIAVAITQKGMDWRKGRLSLEDGH